MNLLQYSSNYKSPLWVILFALISGVFVTGMTGYVTMGLNYPIALILTFLLNIVFAKVMFQGFGQTKETFFTSVMGLFKGNIGLLFSAFAGMIMLMVLLFVAQGESKLAAQSLLKLSGVEMPIPLAMTVIGLLAFLPLLLGFGKSLDYVFSLFIVLIVLRLSFILFVITNSADLPDWSIYNIQGTVSLNSIEGPNGIFYMSFRLAFWSLIGVELFQLWFKKRYDHKVRTKYLLFAACAMIFTMIPGVYLSGLYPFELWQLIVQGVDGCAGDCGSVALGLNLGGETGMIFMALSTIVTQLMMLTVCFMMMSKVILYLSKNKLQFDLINRLFGHEKSGRKEFRMAGAICFTICSLISLINLGSSYWIGLGLYLLFGLALCIQTLCVLNYRFQWFNGGILKNRSMCVLTVLSILMISIMFYSGFKGSHLKYLNYSIILFCFSLWVAATSLVYLIKTEKKEINLKE